MVVVVVEETHVVGLMAEEGFALGPCVLEIAVVSDMLVWVVEERNLVEETRFGKEYFQSPVQ